MHSKTPKSYKTTQAKIKQKGEKTQASIIEKTQAKIKLRVV